MEEYRLIGERLEKELSGCGEKEKHYRDLIELIDRIADYIFKESPRVKKGIGEIHGWTGIGTGVGTIGEID